MAVTRQVSPKGKVEKPQVPEVTVASRETDSKENGLKSTTRTKKYCQFCKNKTTPFYWDASSLRRCMNDRGRISSRVRTGTCAKHQRQVSREIKRARHLALLPFLVRV
ncbi:MAG: 30S ribosomal protein S18 [Candidatus Daviesbacteria bacterium]